VHQSRQKAAKIGFMITPLSSNKMSDNPYESPQAMERRAKAARVTSSLAWWEARRLRYNIGLVLAGVCAFACYIVVCFTLLPRVVDASQIEVSVFTTLFQGLGYLFLMGVANVCYFLGPLSERIVRPGNLEHYREVCYGLGFWFSVLLPFGIPALLAFLVLFCPGYWESP
jgi:hypothetical protein